MQPRTHKVTRERDQRDDATLDSRVKAELGMLEDEGARETEDDSEGHGDGELEEEDGDSVEEGGDGDPVVAVELGEGPGEQRRGGRKVSSRDALKVSSRKALEHLLLSLEVLPGCFDDG